MSAKDIVCAWKNEDYLQSLNAVERSALPENPAGTIELRNSRNQQFVSPHCSIVIECSASNCG